MHHRGHGRRRVSARPVATVAAAVACGAAVAATSMAIAMSSAHAEARSTNARLTLTGMVDGNCPVDVGGTTAYVAPGGTVTLAPSLAGASLTVPLIGTVPVDSGHVASFVDTVTVDGSTHELRGGETLVLHNVTDKTTVGWRATAVTLVPSLLGGITVPLNANNVSLPAGGELDWTGQIIPSAHSQCGVEVAVPTVKASVGTHTVTVPGVGVTVSVPGRSHRPTQAPTSSSASPTGGSSAPPSTRPPTARSHPGTTSSAPGGRAGSAPARSTINRAPWPGPGRHRMPPGGNRDPASVAQHRSNNAVGPAPAGPGGSGASSEVRIRADHRAPAADNQVAAPGTERLTGGSLPALLAIAAMLALSLVTAVYVRQHLLGERRR